MVVMRSINDGMAAKGQGKEASVQTSTRGDFEREDDALDEARGWMHISRGKARYIEVMFGDVLEEEEEEERRGGRGSGQAPICNDEDNYGLSTGRRTDIQMYRYTDVQMYRQSGRQTDRLTD